jgi:hypothetical protein
VALVIGRARFRLFMGYLVAKMSYFAAAGRFTEFINRTFLGISP